MSDHEYLFLLAGGYAVYEFVLRRYFALHKKGIVPQCAALLLSVVLATIKYLVFSAVIANIIFVGAYGLLKFSMERLFHKERYRLEKFLLINAAMILLVTILSAASINETQSAEWFDRMWNFITNGIHTSTQKIVMYVFGYAFVVDGGTEIVKGVLQKFPVLADNAMKAILKKKDGILMENIPEAKQEQENAGELIGILERLLILTFVLVNSYEAVAFVVAAKSVARFSALDDKDFAEYYLLGTSTSVLVAVGIGILLKTSV